MEQLEKKKTDYKLGLLCIYGANYYTVTYMYNF